MLAKPNSQRPQYHVEQNTAHVGQVLARFLGVPLDDDEYYNHLFDYIHNSQTGLRLLSEDTLDKTIDNQKFQSIQKVLNINKEQNLSINRFVAFLDGEQLIVKSTIPSLNRKIREAFIQTLNLFVEKEQNGLQSNELSRVLVDIVKWSNNHLQKEIDSSEIETIFPKYLWYGDYKKSHEYFLYFLIKLGCDLVIFSPSGRDVLKFSDPNEEWSFIYHYPEKREAEPFPIEKRSRKSTVAYRASREIESILNHEGSGLYKAWQLRDYTPTSITLKTTYDELFILMKENAMIRPNFDVSNGEVKIPVVFSKVQGVSKNRKEYWDRLQSISDMDISLLIKRFPFTNSINSNFRFHYRDALGKDGFLDSEKMVRSHYWKYSHLPTGLQNGIATAIKKICQKPALKPINNEPIEEVKVYLFTQALQLSPQIIKLLQKFDYSQAVPKIILYNNELNGTMTRSDAALLLLLNQFGLDIVIYNPPGHNDIENFIDERVYDTHWLDDVVFEQEFKEPSLVKRVLFQGILKNLRGD
jgi:hypothetical protein